MAERVATAVIRASGAEASLEDLPVDSMSLGRGVFETILVLNGKAAFADRHLARLVRSCAALGIAGEGEASAIFHAALARARDFGEPRARLRVAVFAGGSGGAPAGLVAVRPAARRRKPLRLALARSRLAEGNLILAHKTVDYLRNTLEREAAAAEGFDDALWLDAAGNVAETTTANVFFHDGAALITPPSGSILPGIVRDWTMETAPSLGITVLEKRIKAEAAGSFKHAFATNSIVGIAPVAEIGSIGFADPSKAEWFVRLVEAYGAALSL